MYSYKAIKALLKYYVDKAQSIILHSDWLEEELTCDKLKETLLHLKQTYFNSDTEKRPVENTLLIPIKLDDTRWTLIYITHLKKTETLSIIKTLDPFADSTSNAIKYILLDRDLFPGGSIIHIGRPADYEEAFYNTWMIETVRSIINGANASGTYDLPGAKAEHQSILTLSTNYSPNIKNMTLHKAEIVADVLRKEFRFPSRPNQGAVTKMAKETSVLGATKPGFTKLTAKDKATQETKKKDSARLVRAVPLSTLDIEYQVRSEIYKKLVLSDEPLRIYNMVSRQFESLSNFDLDHAFPYKEILKRQKAFLKYLNEEGNQFFAECFLQQDKMSLFFVKKEDGEIWPTNYFIKACYNDIDNLWLLAGGDNSSKSSNSFLGHLESNETFGDTFKNSVDDNGGICRGVILSKIGGNKKTTLTFEGEPTVGIYSGGVGVGQFIINWH